MLPCLPSPYFVHCGFPSTHYVFPSSRITLVELSFVPPAATHTHIPVGTTHGRLPALYTPLRSAPVPPHHDLFGGFRNPPVELRRTFSAVNHSAVSSPNTEVECSIDPSRLGIFRELPPRPNTMEVHQSQHHTRYRKQRGHNKTVMNAPETMAGRLAGACKDSNQHSTLTWRTNNGHNTIERSKITQPYSIPGTPQRCSRSHWDRQA